MWYNTARKTFIAIAVCLIVYLIIILACTPWVVVEEPQSRQNCTLLAEKCYHRITNFAITIPHLNLNNKNETRVRVKHCYGIKTCLSSLSNCEINDDIECLSDMYAATKTCCSIIYQAAWKFVIAEKYGEEEMNILRLISGEPDLKKCDWKSLI
ncbi:unnamed protein product [Caenorhabditis brenneri]